MLLASRLNVPQMIFFNRGRPAVVLQVHRLVSDALQESHEKIMRRLVARLSSLASAGGMELWAIEDVRREPERKWL